MIIGTVKNEFHNTETTLNVIETYETIHGDMIAIVSEKGIAKAQNVLCGMDDCNCGTIHGIEIDGIYHSVTCN